MEILYTESGHPTKMCFVTQECQCTDTIAGPYAKLLCVGGDMYYA